MKRLVLLVLLGALATGVTGCDISPPAATVNGVAISQQTLNTTFAIGTGTTLEDSNARCAEQIQSAAITSTMGVGTEGDGSTPNAVTTTFAAGQLEELILQQLELQALAGRHGVVTATDVAEARADYLSQLQGQQTQFGSPTGCTLTLTSPTAGQLPPAFLHQRAVSLADQEIFEAVVGHVDVSTAGLQAYYRAHLAAVTKECVNIIVTDSQAAAQTVRTLIAGGTSFATAATSSSADTQITPTGGALPCVYPTQLNGQLGTTLAATVNAIPTGQLAPPLAWSTQNPNTGAPVTYYLVVQMRQHQVVPLASLRASVREAVLEQHASVVRATLARMVARAHITVDPRYGTWSVKHGLTIPVPPPPAFLLNPSADSPAAPVAGSGLSLTPSPG